VSFSPSFSRLFDHFVSHSALNMAQFDEDEKEDDGEES
jgi:hypothetical protein